MAINTYGVKKSEFGQYDIADFWLLSLSVFKNNGGLAKSCNQVVWDMGWKKRTPVKKPKRPPPKKLKMSAKGGHERSFQKRMEIAILASRGVLLRLSKPSDAPLTWRSDGLIGQRRWCKLAQFNQNARAKSGLNLFFQRLQWRKNFTGSSRDQYRKSWRRNWQLVLKYLLKIRFKVCEWDDSKCYLSVWWNSTWCFSL